MLKKIMKPLLFGLAFGVCLGVGLVIGSNIGSSGHEDNGGETSTLFLLARLGLFLVSLYAGILFHIIAHEGGHLVFGLISGYKFLSFRIFNLMLVKDGEKIKFKKYGIPGTGGQCLMSPPEPVDGKIPVMLYNLGGSFMNFLWSIIFFAFYFFSDFSVAFILFIPIAGIGVLLGLTNIIPMKNTLGAGVPNDGYNAFMLTKNKDENTAFLIQLQMVAEFSKGARPKDFPREWLEFDGSSDSPFSTVIENMKLSYYMDIHDFDKAKEQAESVLKNSKNIAALYKNEFDCELLFLEIIGERRQEEIERLYTNELKEYIKASKYMISKIRLQYAYEKLVAQDNPNAEKTLKRFESAAAKYPFAGEVESERELIEIVEKQSIT